MWEWGKKNLWAFVLVLGLGTFEPWVNCLYAPTIPTIHFTTISWFLNNFFPGWPIIGTSIFLVHDSPSNLAESRYPRNGWTRPPPYFAESFAGSKKERKKGVTVKPSESEDWPCKMTLQRTPQKINLFWQNNTLRECRSIWSGASGLPYYCAPLVCISEVIESLTVWRHNKPKTKKNNSAL